jgi:hypothetical protein
LKSRGYWKVVVRPEDFVKDRISELQELRDIITQANVSLRGWDFPHISNNRDIQLGIDWIEQKIDWSVHVEAWRFYQSGQFVFFGSMWTDWLDQGHFWSSPKEIWQPGTIFSVEDAVFRYTEIFEFAARLAMTKAGGKHMNVLVELNGLNDRTLKLDNIMRAGFDYPRACSLSSFPQQFSVPLQTLVAEPKLLALKAAKETFARFNWMASLDVLRIMQDELGR